ncbi:5-oxoprolinase subunit PxpA [Alteromonas sp. a30]|uniref:5-oxoprolinase subunit PxpA n=1 Tax=Alteromonas sp. a30 TaxID=2730917 RepID=UPI0022816244|nr:5-oxoprolinase subunit PxpA [Alteromonas sp. a30]
MKINSDLGESFGLWQMGNDSHVMQVVDQANIACGFHAGDPSVMMTTLQLAKEHQVAIGAHPSYPDIQGFGRRSMKMHANEIKNLVLYQVSALHGMAKSLGLEVSYIKPHGALYNDMMRDIEVFQGVLSAATSFHEPLAIMIQSLPNNDERKQAAENAGVSLMFEVFADRRYTDAGLLTPRTQTGAVLTVDEVSQQTSMLVEKGAVLTENGQELSLEVDSICVHGDDAESLEKARCVSKIVQAAKQPESIQRGES